MTTREKRKGAVQRLGTVSFSGFLGLLLLASPSLGAPAGKPLSSVPVCQGVTLSASYLSQVRPGEGPGFLFSLTNHTGREIRLAEPVPSSADWYALTGGKWMWRASSGAGGSLLDATNERGRLLLYKAPSDRVPGGGSFTIPPRQTKNWVESERENPVLEYKPSCPLCSYPGEREYRVVFAYAYLPGEERPGPGSLSWLPCGLRSKPVPMPPKH